MKLDTLGRRIVERKDFSSPDRWLQRDRVSTGWMTEAACHGHEPELWFPVSRPGQSRTSYHNKPATDICDTCRVRLQCLEYALALDIKYGIWGGVTERSRDALLRRQRRLSRQSAG